MSKKIDNNELDMILKDIYDTKIPEEKQFSFKGNTQNIKHTVVQKTAESAENTIDTSTVRPVNVFRRITAAAASLVIIGGLGATVFRNAGFEKNKEIYENDSPAMTSFENPEISVTEVSGNEPEQDEPLKLYTYSDYVWDNFNREIIEYPEGYSLDYSVSSGSRIPYLVMKNENSDDETANEIFRVDLDNRTMKSICNADDYAYNVSADGELYAFYYSENETVTAEQLSGDVGITQLPAISEPGRYEVIKGDRKICVQLNAESNPYLIFFDDNGIANKMTECDLVQNTDEIIDIQYIGMSDCPDGSSMLSFYVCSDSFAGNGYCTVSPDEDEIIQTGLLDPFYFSSDVSCGSNQLRMHILESDEIYGVMDNDELTAELHISEFYENWQDIIDFRYTDGYIFYFFFPDHAEAVTERTGAYKSTETYSMFQLEE